MHPENETKLPPPRRQPERRLTLERAMKAMNKEGEPIRLDIKNHDLSSETSTAANLPRTGMEQENEAYLLEVQAEIIRREDTLCEKEMQLKNFERELNEKEALLEARSKVLELSTHSKPGTVAHNDVAQDALNKLKAELDTQEAALKEAREALQEREHYIEECENTLVQKTTELTEREAMIEQLEEENHFKSSD